MTQTVSERTSVAELELTRLIEDGALHEIEVAWSDPFGHAAG